MPAWSGFWNMTGDMTNYSMLVNKNILFRKMGQLMKRRAMTRMREVIDTVAAGASINGAAAVTYTRVSPSDNVVGQPATGGGRRTIETVEKIAAASSTTAADAAAVDEAVNYEHQPTYPVDRSGNGGGGQLTNQHLLGS